MYALTWRPGTDTLYDPLFDHLREKHFRKRDHPLWQNYNKKHFFDECIAITIAFDGNDMPVLGGSILGRDCWPKNVYRIINRLWSVNPSEGPIKNLHPAGGPLIRSQIEWIKNNYECEMVFISRESHNWQAWTIEQYKRLYDLNFEYDNYRYQVCSTPNNDSCFQRIIYQGNENLLESWIRK